MDAAPDLDASRREWAETARVRLAQVTESVCALRRAFEVAAGEERDPWYGPSERVVASCDTLKGWLAGAKAPRGLGRAEGELGAIAGVYRNAAYAFRNVPGADEQGARSARMAACATMLEQGDHHVDAFLAVLAKKVGAVGPPAEER
jgi:hypothetical protein